MVVYLFFYITSKIRHKHSLRVQITKGYLGIASERTKAENVKTD